MKRRLPDSLIRPDGTTRRAFLRGSAATTLLVGCGVSPEDETVGLPAALTSDGLNDDPEATPAAPLAAFPLGLASGDVTPWSALVWTKFTGTNPLHLAVWQMEGGQYTRVLLTRVTPVEGFVHAEVTALTPGFPHRYAFFEESAGTLVRRSPIGRFRTALAPDALAPVSFGAVACTSNGRTMSTLERAGARSDLDLFCLLGDTTYNDGVSTRAAFRGRWTENLSTLGYRRVREATSVLATWDDHEVTNDWNPETIDPTLLATATAAFFEHLPIRRNPDAANRVYRKHRWGKTVEFFVLDSRSERRPSSRGSSMAQYLSRAQMDWLKAGLAASPVVFKVILNSVPITNFPGLFDFVAHDRWEGYPAARTEILSYVENARIPGVLWVAGDFHMASTGRVSRSGVGSRAIEVLAGPGAQTGNPLAGTLFLNPQFDFFTATSNYTSIALDPATRRVRVRFHDGSDRVIGDRSYVV